MAQDKGEYCLEDKNTMDNPVDNAPSRNAVIADPSPEQSVTSMCGSRKNPYPPHGRSLEIPRGKGGLES